MTQADSLVKYLLILGCRVKGELPEQTLSMRIARAAGYLKANAQVTAIACGGVVHADQSVSEAEVIRRSLERLGIDSGRVLLEDNSKTTAENFLNARAILGSYSGGVAFLTSDFHVRRAKIIARRCGFEQISAVSAPSPKKKLVQNTLRELLAFLSVPFMRHGG